MSYFSILLKIILKGLIYNVVDLANKGIIFFP